MNPLNSAVPFSAQRSPAVCPGKHSRVPSAVPFRIALTCASAAVLVLQGCGSQDGDAATVPGAQLSEQTVAPTTGVGLPVGTAPSVVAPVDPISGQTVTQPVEQPTDGTPMQPTNTAVAGDSPNNAAAAQPIDPGTKGIHRLNDVEYNFTIQDLFDDPSLELARGWLPGEAYGFDNIAAVLRVDESQYERYFDAATEVADRVFARPEQVAKIVSCEASAECAGRIAAEQGLRIWRRPLSADDVSRLVAVYDRAVGEFGRNHVGGVKEMLRVFLASPDFIFRIETDPDPTSDVPHNLTAFELATRLSYFLWSSTPDDALLAKAQSGVLLTSEGLAAQVQEMIDSPKSQRFTEGFVGQWLGIRGLAGHRAFVDLFPDWSPELAQSMQTEAYKYFGEFLQADDLAWSEFLRTDINFPDARLAAHYDMPAPSEPFSRVEFTEDERLGFLGLGAFLTVTSFPERTSPTLRASHILADLMCTPPPEAPPAVQNQIEEQQAAAEAEEAPDDIRQWLETHRSNPGCAACHSIFDPYGMALEHFDAIGKYRTNYRSGHPVDPSAVLIDGTVLSGFRDMVETLSADDRLSQCVAERMFVYGLGRGLLPTDQPYLDAISATWSQQQPATLKGLVESFVLSDTFRQRRGTKL